MRRVFAEATIESLRDIWDARRGKIPSDRVRRVTVADALVDTETKALSMPTTLIRQLGLEEQPRKRVRSSVGISEVVTYAAVRMTIQGRDCTMDVIEVPDGSSVLIGHLVLLQLDFVIDPPSRSLIGNPAHGGEQMFEL